MSGSRREQLERLILEAHELIRRARLESREIVADAERRARELVGAAEELHRAAAAEAGALRGAARAERAERRALESKVGELQDRLRDSEGSGHPDRQPCEHRHGAHGHSPDPGQEDRSGAPATGRRTTGPKPGEDLETDERTAIRRFRRRA